MDASEEREQRQFRLMEDRLSSFELGEIDLRRTIADLEGLIAALELTPDLWKRRFREEWGQLDIAYAIALGSKGPVPDATDPLLRQACRNMMELVREMHR
jgi:hypothetical protein